MPWDLAIYGLVLRADHPLPGFVEVTGSDPAEVLVRLAAGCADLPPGDWELLLEEGGGECPSVRLFASRGPAGISQRLVAGIGSRVFECVVDPPGDRVWLLPPPDSDRGEDAAFLIWQVIPHLLLARGYACLHASAVQIGGRAVAFCGNKGVGKSTMVAALAERGHPAVADDIVALTAILGAPGSAGFLVHPGYPGLRLSPEAVRRVIGPGHGIRTARNDAGGGVGSAVDKSFVDLIQERRPHILGPSPLAAIYHFGPREPGGDAVRIEPVRPASALTLLDHHAQGAVTVDRTGRSRHFEVLARLAASVPIRRVVRPDGFDRLPSICEAIEDDVGRLPAPADSIQGSA